MKFAVWSARMLAAGALLVGAYSGQAAQEPPSKLGDVPVVVELFTSEGCSSCPPADDALARIAAEQPLRGVRIIALGQHVDYWDRLGWKDPFSSAKFTQRQIEYAKTLRMDDVYTPQTIINGTEQFVGGDRRRLRSAVSRAARAPRAAVTLAPGKAGSFTVRASDLPRRGLPPGEKVEVYVAVTEDGLTTAVERGENAGRKLSHAAVVRRLERVGVWDPEKGGAFEATFAAALRPRQRVVAFLQAEQSRRILGAAEAAP